MIDRIDAKKRTLGGQVVGGDPLHCETAGASDYCQHCGREVIDLSPCPVLETLRLKNIPDENIAAFGCAIESLDPPNEPPCEKWCHEAGCPIVLRQALTLKETEHD